VVLKIIIGGAADDIGLSAVSVMLKLLAFAWGAWQPDDLGRADGQLQQSPLEES
jgi:hypothetical protein